MTGIEQEIVVTSNPSDTDNNVASSQRDSSPLTVTLYKIDETILDYFANVMKPVVINDEKQLPVPVMWGSPERWKAIRKDGFIRDQYDKLQVPVIMIRRSGITRNPLTSPVNKYLSKSYSTGWNRHNSYDRFNVLNGINPSRRIVNVTLPDYIDLQYDVLLWTEYNQQMNELIEQINFEADEFWGRKNSFKFRVNIANYTSQHDLPATSDRVVRTSFVLNVKAYLLPEKMQAGDKGTTFTVKDAYTIKKVVTFTEIDGIGVQK